MSSAVETARPEMILCSSVKRRVPVNGDHESDRRGVVGGSSGSGGRGRGMGGGEADRSRGARNSGSRAIFGEDSSSG